MMASHHHIVASRGAHVPPSPAAQIGSGCVVRPGVPGACRSMSPNILYRQAPSHPQNTRPSVVAEDPVKPLHATAQSSPAAIDVPVGTASSVVATAVSEPKPEAPTDGQWKAACERQISWLEEDIAVLSRRIKMDCGECVGPPADIAALMTCLDADAAAERQSRLQLDARLKALEDAVSQEHEERETHLQTTSNEVELAMKDLIGRIDEGLSASASSMRQRTDQTEQTLRTLIKRVDEGLSAGANALQSTLTKSLVGFPPGSTASLTPRGRRGSQSPQQQCTLPERLEQTSLEGSSKSLELLSPRPEVQPVPVQSGSIARTSPATFGRSPRAPAQANPCTRPVSEGTQPGHAAQPAPAPTSWMSTGKSVPQSPTPQCWAWTGRSVPRSPMGSPLAACPSSLQVPGTGLSSVRACAPAAKSHALPIRPDAGSGNVTPSWAVNR
eukprot:TRINITY_DN10174_c0_g2_i1.p1 TRINITY_DN10174_c0_g2~~TRINITY_DN10174_c0_g2_i1.p1  ORF type:complete len:442 (-),score=38.94 TRINITY_DN10174_c0_g2_i1:74-1399(-)